MEIPSMNSELKRYLVPPVRFALSHLNKPFDLAAVAQTAIATGHVEIDLIGATLDLDHPKVSSKVDSWNIKHDNLDKINIRRFSTIEELKKNSPNLRVIGTVVRGGDNAFNFEWEPNDIIIIGGANGLSRHDLKYVDELVTIPTTPETNFLTVSTVIPVLTYHILSQRKLWDKV